MYFVTLRFSDQSRTVASSMSSTVEGRRPVVVRRGACRARVQDAADLDAGTDDLLRPLLGEASDPDDESWTQDVDDLRQSIVTGPKELAALDCRKLVRGSVSPGVLHEDEWAPVRDERPREEL